jgi:hypothetical protein
LGEPQPGKSRLYQVKDRSWQAERKLAGACVLVCCADCSCHGECAGWGLRT